jgi:hypothetical protein
MILRELLRDDDLCHTTYSSIRFKYPRTFAQPWKPDRELASVAVPARPLPVSQGMAMVPALELKDAEFRTAMQLGISPMPAQDGPPKVPE